MSWSMLMAATRVLPVLRYTMKAFPIPPTRYMAALKRVFLVFCRPGIPWRVSREQLRA